MPRRRRVKFMTKHERRKKLNNLLLSQIEDDCKIFALFWHLYTFLFTQIF